VCVPRVETHQKLLRTCAVTTFLDERCCSVLAARKTCQLTKAICICGRDSNTAWQTCRNHPQAHHCIPSIHRLLLGVRLPTPSKLRKSVTVGATLEGRHKMEAPPPLKRSKWKSHYRFQKPLHPQHRRSQPASEPTRSSSTLTVFAVSCVSLCCATTGS